MDILQGTGGIVLAAWMAGAVLLVVSYMFAGPIWVERHSLHWTMEGRAFRCSGAIGEMVLLGMAGLTLVWVDSFTPAWSMLDLILRFWPVWLIILLAVGAVVVGYSRTVPADARKQGHDEAYCGCLARTYAVYGVYSTLLFFGGMVLIGTLVSQFIYDQAAFQGMAADVVARTYGAAGATGPVLMETVEQTFLDSIRTLNAARDQMSPVFVFAASIFIFNFLILSTPLKGVFRQDARLLTHATTIVAIVVILLAGGVMYVTIYSTFIDRYVEALLSLRPSLENAGWEYYRRYGDIVFTLEENRSLVGFISKMSSEWGGLAAIIGLAQWAVDRLTAPSRAGAAAQAPA